MRERVTNDGVNRVVLVPPALYRRRVKVWYTHDRETSSRALGPASRHRRHRRWLGCHESLEPLLSDSSANNRRVCASEGGGGGAGTIRNRLQCRSLTLCLDDGSASLTHCCSRPLAARVARHQHCERLESATTTTATAAAATAARDDQRCAVVHAVGTGVRQRDPGCTVAS